MGAEHTIISLYVSPAHKELAAKLEEAAKTEDRSLNYVVWRAVEVYFELQKAKEKKLSKLGKDKEKEESK